MNRRLFLQRMGLGAAATLVLDMPGWAAPLPSGPPNVLLVLVDDLGRQDPGCYGNAVIDTPVMDRLAAEGMRFTEAYSSCPVCSPTRAALLTGKSTARVHFTGHITSIRKHRHPAGSAIIPPDDLMYIPLEEVTIAEALKPAGYTSASIGKWHVGHEGYFPGDQGFDVNVAGWTHGSPPSYWDPYTSDKDWNSSIPTLPGRKPGEYLTDRLTDEAIGFITDHREGPFFCYLPHYAVHTPLQAPPELVEKYRKLGDTGIDPVYAAMVERVDMQLGRLLAVLDGLDIADNTVVIVASDNGAVEEVTNNAPYRRGKGHLYEGGLRVPLIVRWPGRVARGSVCNTPTLSEDLYATIIDMAGEAARPGTPIDGESLKPVLTGAGTCSQRDLHWYYPHYSPQGNAPGAALRSGQWKLLTFYDPVRTELYDLENDPGETHNLAAQEPGLAADLTARLRQWLMDCGTVMHTHNPDAKKVPTE